MSEFPDDPHVPILEPPKRDPPQRRETDRVLPTLYHFILSLVVVLGCFGYLYAAKPGEVVSAAILGFVATVIGYWFLKKGGAN